MLSVKQGGIKCHFLSLWYDSTWDWTQVSQTIGRHSTHSLISCPVYKIFVFTTIINLSGIIFLVFKLVFLSLIQNNPGVKKKKKKKKI